MAVSVGERAEGDPMSEINTTPLIDVMLVLLIMLIVALPPQRHAVKLDSPRPNQNPPPQDEIIQPITVVVDFDGTYYWNNEVVSAHEMESRFKVEAQREKQAEVHIQPHKLAKYKWVARVMASAQRNGMTKLGVIGGTQ